MKFAVIALVASTVSAAWGTWDSSNYCDFNNEVIKEKAIPSGTVYTAAQCAAFCEDADRNAYHISYGTSECCDYESWSDGSTDCTLYMGSEVLPNYSSSGSDFRAMTFESGDYFDTVSLVGKTKKAMELSLRQRK